MTAFDAHLRPRGDDSAWRLATAIISNRPGVLIAAIVAAATVVCLAFLMLVAIQEGRVQVTRAVDGLQASVYLHPRTSRAAAEALKAQLEALPFVRDAALRTKEAAIVALETSGLQANSRSNPLPDVWIVTLGFGAPDDAAKSLTDRVTEARRSLALLPEVETVDLDTAWLATLERWQVLSATGVRVGLLLLFSLTWIVLGCIFSLAGNAFAGAPVQRERGGAAAVVGVLIGVGTLLTSVALVAVATYGFQSVGLDWKPIAIRFGQMSGAFGVGLVVSVMALAVAAIATSGRR